MFRRRYKRLKCRYKVNKNEQLYEDLIKECRYSSKGLTHGLSPSLRKRLDSCTPDVRKKIASSYGHWGTPLLNACLNRKIEIADYLLTHLKADVDQPGRENSCQTQLIRCISLNRVPFVKLLLSHGANANAVSDNGMTALQVACSLYRDPEIISSLLENGADPNVKFKIDSVEPEETKNNDTSCLIVCVSSLLSVNDKLIALLLKHGADVNATNNIGHTALHIAIDLNELNRVIILLNHNADPFLRNSNNDDALQSACINKSLDIIKHLMRTVYYSPKRKMENCLLMSAVFNWYRTKYNMGNALYNRYMAIPKDDILYTSFMPAMLTMRFEGFRCRTGYEVFIEENLDQIKRNYNPQKSKNLIILERILGLGHSLTLERFVEEAESFHHNLRFQDSVNLWRQMMKDLMDQNRNIFYGPKFFLHSFSKFIGNMQSMLFNRPKQSFDDVSSLFGSIVVLFSRSASMLPKNSYPYKFGSVCLEKTFETILSLLSIMLEIVQSADEKSKMYQLVRMMVELDPRSLATNCTVLHRFLDLKSDDFLYRNLPFVLKRIKLLIECGANVNARNKSRRTPLHMARNQPRNIIEPVVNLLLDHGAYPFTPDDSGVTPAMLLKYAPLMNTNLQNYNFNLAVLAARAVVKHKLNTEKLPASSRILVECHR